MRGPEAERSATLNGAAETRAAAIAMNVVAEKIPFMIDD